jgi:hypothetical protein
MAVQTEAAREAGDVIRGDLRRAWPELVYKEDNT